MGKDVGRNKFAVQHKADFLFMPCSFEKPEMDAGIARIAAENDITIAILFSDFLKAGALQRSMGFKNYQLVNLLCKKFGTKIEVFSGAKKESELRSPRDLKNLMALLE